MFFLQKSHFWSLIFLQITVQVLRSKIFAVQFWLAGYIMDHLTCKIRQECYIETGFIRANVFVTFYRTLLHCVMQYRLWQSSNYCHLFFVSFHFIAIWVIHQVFPIAFDWKLKQNMYVSQLYTANMYRYYRHTIGIWTYRRYNSL